jgi:hypothetical protein
MVVYATDLGNQRQICGGDIKTATGKSWPVAARQTHAGTGIDPSSSSSWMAANANGRRLAMVK